VERDGSPPERLIRLVVELKQKNLTVQTKEKKVEHNIFIVNLDMAKEMETAHTASVNHNSKQ
jgi:hypothetical protein